MSLQILHFLALMSISQGTQFTYRSINCSNPLGMESGEIKDEDITASSAFNFEHLSPQFGRLGYDKEGGAWCPNNSDSSPWLQIDLHQRHTLTGIATQGRYDQGRGREYVEMYLLQYYDPLQNEWQFYRNATKSERVEGNNDTNSIKRTTFDNPIMALKVRISPIRQSVTVCLRAELYGCLWSEGVVGIHVPRGDGKPLENRMASLFDGIIPSSNTNEGWMVWSNATIQQEQPLEITFKFDKIRAFQAVHLLVKEPLKSANISFSIDGKYYSNPLTWEPGDGTNLTYNLHNQPARLVKMLLRAKEQSLSVGEIVFDSSLNYYDHYRYYSTTDECANLWYIIVIVILSVLIVGFAVFAIWIYLNCKKSDQYSSGGSLRSSAVRYTSSERGTVVANNDFDGFYRFNSADK